MPGVVFRHPTTHDFQGAVGMVIRQACGPCWPANDWSASQCRPHRYAPHQPPPGRYLTAYTGSAVRRSHSRL